MMMGVFERLSEKGVQRKSGEGSEERGGDQRGRGSEGEGIRGEGDQRGRGRMRGEAW